VAKPVSRFSDLTDRLRLRLARVDDLPKLSVLGVIAGLMSGAVIVAFRLCIESAQRGFLPEANPENYEALWPPLIVVLPAGGGLLLGLLFHFAGKGSSVRVGVVHVMERLAYHQGYLPARNAVLQFVGAAVSIVSGHSVGREGPGIHLGATSGSALGQWLGLPNNSIRTLVGCGTAAAIAAGFNTPLAGVILTLALTVVPGWAAPPLPSPVLAMTLKQAARGYVRMFQAISNLAQGRSTVGPPRFRFHG